MGDAGNNLNQFCLKFSSQESRLYKHLNKQYTRYKIFEKMRDVRKFSELYGCGKISKTILKKINDRFRDCGLCFPDVKTIKKTGASRPLIHSFIHLTLNLN
jgi:hypothetical protein